MLRKQTSVIFVLHSWYEFVLHERIVSCRLLPASAIALLTVMTNVDLIVKTYAHANAKYMFSMCRLASLNYFL